MPSLMLHGDEEPPAPRGPSVVASGGDARDTLNLRSALLLLLFSRGSSAQGLCTQTQKFGWPIWLWLGLTAKNNEA